MEVSLLVLIKLIVYMSSLCVMFGFLKFKLIISLFYYVMMVILVDGEFE